MWKSRNDIESRYKISLLSLVKGDYYFIGTSKTVYLKILFSLLQNNVFKSCRWKIMLSMCGATGILGLFRDCLMKNI